MDNNQPKKKGKAGKIILKIFITLVIITLVGLLLLAMLFGGILLGGGGALLFNRMEGFSSLFDKEEDQSEIEVTLDAPGEDDESENRPVDEPDDDVTSEDVVSIDGDSEDVTVDTDESSAEESADSFYKTTPKGNNYARNSSYTVTREGESDPAYIYLHYPSRNDWADLDHTRLTDGVVGDCSTYFTAEAAQAGVSVLYAGTGRTFEFEFDLGEHYGDIESLVFRQARHGTPNGNNRGFEVKYIEYSDDGENWTRASGVLTSTLVPGSAQLIGANMKPNAEFFDFTYTFDSTVKCRYMRLVLSNDGGYCLQFEELEIRN